MKVPHKFSRGFVLLGIIASGLIFGWYLSSILATDPNAESQVLGPAVTLLSAREKPNLSSDSKEAADFIYQSLVGLDRKDAVEELLLRWWPEDRDGAISWISSLAKTDFMGFRQGLIFVAKNDRDVALQLWKEFGGLGRNALLGVWLPATCEGGDDEQFSDTMRWVDESFDGDDREPALVALGIYASIMKRIPEQSIELMSEIANGSPKDELRRYIVRNFTASEPVKLAELLTEELEAQPNNELVIDSYRAFWSRWFKKSPQDAGLYLDENKALPPASEIRELFNR